MVHGDDFVSTGPSNSLKWLEGVLNKEFKIKNNIMGPAKDCLLYTSDAADE